MKSELKALHPREYRIWKAMKARCYAPCNANIHNYQKNNIKVCDRWLHSFPNFFEDMGEAPDGYSIDRIDNLGDYSPDNCRWADDNTQAKNRSITKNYTYNGITMCVKDWSRYFDIKYTTLMKRLNSGWSFEEAISDDFENMVNKKKNKSSGIKGVCYHKGHKKWRVIDYVDGKQVGIGEYETKEEAVIAMKEYRKNNA